MTQYASMIRKLKTAPVMESLIHLYGNRDGMLVAQTARYINLLKRKGSMAQTATFPSSARLGVRKSAATIRITTAARYSRQQSIWIQ